MTIRNDQPEGHCRHKEIERGKKTTKELGWIYKSDRKVVLESDRKVMCFSVIFMEIVNIMHCIEAKVFTSWTRRERFLLDLLTIQWSSYRMNFGFKPWEMVDASTRGLSPGQLGNRTEVTGGDRSGRLLHSISLASFSSWSYRIL